MSTTLNMKTTIEDAARAIAETTTVLMYATVHRVITPHLTKETEGDEYDAIHAKVIRLAVEIMHKEIVKQIS